MKSADRTARLVTLGCKVNQYETQLVRESLRANGFREAAGDESADLCIVNTCTVTNTGDSKSRQVIRQLARKHPGTKTIVMGCYATRDPQTVSELPNVIEVVTDKRELPDVLGRFGIVDMVNGISEFEGRHRAFVKVQDGCILRCSYCIIPAVRPGIRSRRPGDIEDEFRRLIDNGYRELVISGIHVGHFGIDTNNLAPGARPERLWDLLRRLDRIPGDWRMRLSSIEMVEFNSDFIKAAQDCEHLCRQFHPALQSGSEAVLQRMKRRYRVSRFLERMEQVRDELGDDVALTTDIIVGFPGETDAEFEETLETCRQARFMKIHVFPFSRRDGTPASQFPDQLDGRIVKERVHRMGELERDLAVQYYNERVQDGIELEVLAERVSEHRTGYIRGTDRRYMPVEIPGSESELGNFIRGHAVSTTRQYVTARRGNPSESL